MWREQAAIEWARRAIPDVVCSTSTQFCRLGPAVAPVHARNAHRYIIGLNKSTPCTTFNLTLTISQPIFNIPGFVMKNPKCKRCENFSFASQFNCYRKGFVTMTRVLKLYQHGNYLIWQQRSVKLYKYICWYSILLFSTCAECKHSPEPRWTIGEHNTSSTRATVTVCIKVNKTNFK